MDAVANLPNPPAERTLDERIDAKARYLARLVQGSQLLEAAAVDAAGYAALIEAAAKMLRDGDPRKI